MSPKPLDIYVIGGGAAGFFGAIRAASCFPDAQISILEKTSKLLQKVKVSGGGRCNVTHTPHPHSQFAKKYPRGDKFLKKNLGKFSAADTISWFAERGMQVHTEADGRVFPLTNDSSTVIDCFLREAKRLGIKIILQADIQEIRRQGACMHLIGKDRSWLADRVLVATGGHPKISGYDWLASTGHTIAAPVPSLFTFNLPKSSLKFLAGVAVPQGAVQLAGTSFSYSGPILITHWGLSGPAILKLSAYAAEWLHQHAYKAEVLVRWVALEKEEELRKILQGYASEHKERTVQKYSLFDLPTRLWIYLCSEAGIGEAERWLDLSKKKVNRLIEMLFRQPQQLQGKTTFKEEFVNCGGIPLDEINTQTMESKVYPGLYFAGEVMHIDGITGGFNFQAAWTTAWLAGTHIGQ